MFTDHQLSTRPRTELKYQADHKTRRKYYKNEYVFWEICSNGNFMGKVGTTIQIFCATKLEVSVYVWNEIIQEVIELLIWRTFLIWSYIGLGLYLLFFGIGVDQVKGGKCPKIHRLVYHFPVVWCEIFPT